MLKAGAAQFEIVGAFLADARLDGSKPGVGKGCPYVQPSGEHPSAQKLELG
jgi:hypothetical protein